MFKEGNVTVMVSDLGKAIRFCTEVLGPRLKSRMGDDWAEVQAPGLIIGLHPLEEKWPPGPPGGLSIGLVVDDLDRAMAALTGKGVAFMPRIIEDGPVRIALLSDPDRNPLYLCQVTPQK